MSAVRHSNLQRHGRPVGAKGSRAGRVAAFHDHRSHPNHTVHSVAHTNRLEIRVSLAQAVVHQQRVHFAIPLQRLVLSRRVDADRYAISDLFHFH